jgi:hypothetical protein
MFKSKRESLIVTTVQNEKLSCRAIVLRHEVSKMIILKRLKEKRIMNDFSKNRQLLFEQEETIILKFVNQFIALRFFFRIYMIEKKVILLLQKRQISKSKLKRHWVYRFLKRHSEYWTKFSRHFDQERHWSFDSTIFVQLFDLMKKTMIKYNIAIEDVYNMNEKKYMMKMSDATQWMLFFVELLDFFRISRLFVAFFVYFKMFNWMRKSHVLKIVALTRSSTRELEKWRLFRTNFYSAKWSFDEVKKTFFRFIRAIESKSVLLNLC